MKKSNMVSVDLKAFFGSLLEQWKCVVLVAVIGAILMPCAMSLKTNDEARSEADRYKELSMMSDDEKLNTLPELDRVRVDLALKQKGLIEQQEAYYANSIVDPMLEQGMLPVLKFHWIISGTDNDSALKDAYLSTLSDADTVAVIRNVLAPEYAGREDIYINELISTESSDGFVLSIVIPEGTDVELLKNSIIERAEAASQALSEEFGKHKLSLVSAEETKIVPEERIALKTQKDIEYKDLKEYYTSLLLEFDYSENVVFDSITVEDDTRNVYVDPGISFSPKMIVAGFAAGLIVYVFVYLVYVVLSSKVHDSSVITEMLGVEKLGVISRYSHKGIGAFVFSRNVYKMLRKNSVDGKSIDSTAEAAVNMCRYGGYGKVLFVNQGMKKDFSEEAKQLADKVNKGCGIELKTVETIKDAKALDGIDAVIMCISSGSTKYSEIIDIARLCGHCDKTIVGGVWLD